MHHTDVVGEAMTIIEMNVVDASLRTVSFE
jgi:hypothetical protein